MHFSEHPPKWNSERVHSDQILPKASLLESAMPRSTCTYGNLTVSLATPERWVQLVALTDSSISKLWLCLSWWTKWIRVRHSSAQWIWNVGSQAPSTMWCTVGSSDLWAVQQTLPTSHTFSWFAGFNNLDCVVLHFEVNDSLQVHEGLVLRLNFIIESGRNRITLWMVLLSASTPKTINRKPTKPL